VDIGGHPPIPNSNWLIWKFFSSACFSVMGTFIFNCGFFTYGVVSKPYIASRCILVVSHLFQLAYFGIFHAITYLCTSRVVLGLQIVFFCLDMVKLQTELDFEVTMHSPQKYLSNGLSHA
jgi:hypothetical protein